MYIGQSNFNHDSIRPRQTQIIYANQYIIYSNNAATALWICWRNSYDFLGKSTILLYKHIQIEYNHFIGEIINGGRISYSISKSNISTVGRQKELSDVFQIF